MTKASRIPSPDDLTSDRALVRRHLDQLDLPVKISEEEKTSLLYEIKELTHSDEGSRESVRGGAASSK